MNPLHESAEVTAAALAEPIAGCPATHPRRPGITCTRAVGHLRKLDDEGYLAWHEGTDSSGNTYRWR